MTRRRTKGKNKSYVARDRGFLKKHTGLIIGAVVVVAVAGLITFSVINQTSASKNFTFTTYSGHEVPGISTSSAKWETVIGQGTPVMLNFYGGDCPPCRAEMPDLQSVYSAHSEEVVFFGLDVGPFLGLGTREQGQRLLQQLGITYSAGYSDGAGPIAAYEITGLPQTVFFSADGQEVRTVQGVISRSRLEGILVNELGVPGS